MTKVETIFEHSANNGAEGELGIDNKGQLYWNKKQIITKKKIRLDWWVNVSIIIASLSTLAMAIYSALDYYCK